jgi:hypothetical protein
MPKGAKYSQVARELKKEYLREHLKSVNALILSWMTELHLPEPLALEGRIWGWQLPYRSPRQNNPDDNHTLRRHLKSRALWSHHSNWERKLEEIWRLTEQVRLKAQVENEKRVAKKEWKYSEEYAPLALWKAFDMALGKIVNLSFTVPSGELGVSCGAYRIEESASTPEERLSVEDEYKRYISYLSRASTMKRLADSWQEARQLEGHILAIADKMQKSGDIFYVCGFCKHLWV